MKMKKVLCIIVSCLVFLTLLSSCASKNEKKYKVLFKSSSDSSTALLIPLDTDDSHEKRDTNQWPDEMEIQYEGVTYNCSIFEFYGKGGCRYLYTDTERRIGFVLNNNKDIINYSCREFISEEEKNKRDRVTEEEAIEIAERIFRNNFDVDYSQYEMVSAKIDELVHVYTILFRKKYDHPKIVLCDWISVDVGLYNDYTAFYGSTLGSVITPQEKPDADEIQHSIEERIKDLLKEQKISFSDFKVNIKEMGLFYNKEYNRYSVSCFFTYDCKGTIDGVEKDFHDYIEAVVICNDLK